MPFSFAIAMIDHDLQGEKCHIISVHQREFYFMPVTKQKSNETSRTCNYRFSFLHTLEVFHQFSRFMLFFFLLVVFSDIFWTRVSKDSNFSTSNEIRFFIVSFHKRERILSRLRRVNGNLLPVVFFGKNRFD